MEIITAEQHYYLLEMPLKDILTRLQTALELKFTKDPQFVLSNQMLDEKIKQLKKDGMQNLAINLQSSKKILRNLKKVIFSHLPSPFPF